MPDFSIETRFDGIVCGIDEAGRGPWAGPVVAAAVVIDRAQAPSSLLARLDDSKKLSLPKREELFRALPAFCRVGVGQATVAEIDELNILQATYLAMNRAVEDLGAPLPDRALIDGNRLPREFPCWAEAVIKGDSLSLSIAAASVIAKVTRDRIMADLDRSFPGYGWARNAGYGVAAHRAAIAELGVTEHHRRSFKPIKALLQPSH